MKVIDFYGDKLEIVDMGSSAGVVARRLVENLGLSWGNQSEKLQDPLYMCSVIRTHDSSGRNQEMLVIPIKSLPAFLFSINPRKVRQDLQEKLARYRLECVDVLYNYWARGYAVNPRPTLESTLTDYVSGIGAVHLHFLNTFLEECSSEHSEAMSQIIQHILTEALEVEDLDLQNNVARRKEGWVPLNTVELTVLQTVESEIGLFFAKNGVPTTPSAVLDMSKEIGKKTTHRLRKAMYVSENFSDQFEERISDILGVK